MHCYALFLSLFFIIHLFILCIIYPDAIYCIFTICFFFIFRFKSIKAKILAQFINFTSLQNFPSEGKKIFFQFKFIFLTFSFKSERKSYVIVGDRGKRLISRLLFHPPFIFLRTYFSFKREIER